MGYDRKSYSPLQQINKSTSSAWCPSELESHE
jgi:hypothetical protein